MEVTKPRPWGCYASTRLILSTLDTLADFGVCGVLFSSRHIYEGGAVLALVLLSLALSVVFVAINRCVTHHRDSMPCGKWLLLIIHAWVVWCQPIFQSGPQLVFQLNLIWRATHNDSLPELFDESSAGSALWLEGLLIICSIVLALMSLSATLMNYNLEHGGPGAKRSVAAFFTVITAVSLRAFLWSVMFNVLALAAVVTIIVVYLISLILVKYMDRESGGWNCIIDAYVSIVCPSGHARVLGTAQRYLPKIPSSISEVERVKINQERHFENCRMSYVGFCTLNALLIIVLAALAEAYRPEEASDLIFDRKFLYITPCVFFVLNIAMSSWHLQQVRTGRDAARTWHTLTPRRPKAVNKIIREGGSGNSSSFVTPNAPTPVFPTAPEEDRQSPFPLLPANNPSSTAGGFFYPTLHAEIDLRHVSGTYKFHKEDCVTCDLLQEGASFTSTATGKSYKFMPAVSCNDRSLVYLVTCINPDCLKQYVGKTEQELRQRHYGHRREIETKSSELGRHFAESCGYTSFRIQVIDQVHETDSNRRKKEIRRREGYWQHELMTFVPQGLNTRDELPDV